MHFTRYESGKYLKYGRPLKMDRQTIVAVVAALEEWLNTDHTARFANYVRQVDMLKAKLARACPASISRPCASPWTSVWCPIR